MRQYNLRNNIKIILITLSFIFSFHTNADYIPGQKIKISELPKSWSKLFDFNSDVPGMSGSFFLDLNVNNEIDSLIVLNFDECNNFFCYRYSKNIYIENLNPETALLFDSNSNRTTSYIYAPNFSKKYGGMIKVRMLSEGSIFGPEYDEFETFEIRIGVENEIFIPYVKSNTTNSYVMKFNEMVAKKRTILGKAVGVKEVNFNSNSYLQSSIYF